ncbi:DUF3718 domain-containing protein [Psychrobium sp. MM17-31]|uniref:DUF3718 domain-containing protein n=1 Tax=Psychrobium sp. MM17-31 TaxID=2917758 RepID=UPI001EF57390|nr:DUF3718 domain-containing protein [Psychrobium sp. MM17-31]MCG7533031.1 DUF3718 domain-containing protein [Psychrobium sp. MM17-31]
MKTLLLTLASGLLLTSTAAHAGQFKFVAGNDSPYTQFCVAAANNNLMNYNQRVDSSGLSDRHVAKNTQCNGENIANFAAKYGADKTAKHINRFRRGNITITDYAYVGKSETKDLTVVTVN